MAELVMGIKATKFEKMKRVDEIRRMMLIGVPRDSILRFAAEHYNISERTCDWYMMQARNINIDILRESQEDSLGEALAYRRYLRCLAHEQKDFHLALEIVKDEAKLRGLYQAIQIHNLNIDYDALTDEQIMRLDRGEAIYSVINSA